jgi:hypothetical protein
MSSPNDHQGSSQSTEEEMSWEEQSRLMDQLLISDEPNRTGGETTQQNHATEGDVATLSTSQDDSNSDASIEPVLPTREEFLANGLEPLTGNDAGPFDDCVICQEEITNSTAEDPEHPVRIVGCRHIFHNDCLHQWLTSNEVSIIISCPICRFRLFENADYAVYIPPEEESDSDFSEEEAGIPPPNMPFPMPGPAMAPFQVEASTLQRLDELIAASETTAVDELAQISEAESTHEQDRAELQARFLQMGGFQRLFELQRPITEMEGRGEQVPQEMEEELENFREELLEVWRRLQTYEV